jgi:hypothetical protein
MKETEVKYIHKTEIQLNAPSLNKHAVLSDTESEKQRILPKSSTINGRLARSRELDNSEAASCSNFYPSCSGNNLRILARRRRSEITRANKKTTSAVLMSNKN